MFKNQHCILLDEIITCIILFSNNKPSLKRRLPTINFDIVTLLMYVPECPHANDGMSDAYCHYFHCFVINCLTTLVLFARMANN